MPLIEAVPKGKTIKLEVELDRETHATLNKYLRFSRADINRVVSGALQRLFKEDEEFGPWLKANPSKKKDKRKEPSKDSSRATDSPTEATSDRS